MPSENLNQDPSQPGFIDLYAFFKISKQASDSEIDRVFRKMSKAFHPDRNRTNPEATAMFAKLSAWRDLLKDPERRAEYDEDLAWFNEEKNRQTRSSRRPRPAGPRQPSPSSSTFGSGRSDYDPPPRYESWPRNDYDPDCPDCEPLRQRSSRHREEPEYRSSARSRPSQGHRRYDDEPRRENRPPRYETRTPDDYQTPRYESRSSRDFDPNCPDCEPSRHRSSRRRDEPECNCPDCQPLSRSSRRPTEYVILVDADDEDYDDNDGPIYEYDQGPFGREPRYESREPRTYYEPRSSGCGPSSCGPRRPPPRSRYDNY